VILYFHGGGFLLPMADYAASFWRYIQEQLKSKNKDVGFAILQYSLVPTARFPTQLKQAVLAVQHLVASGVEPRNIQIVGDSAGANLALQLLSHMLHPEPSAPRINLSTPLGGVYLMSPWVSLTSKAESMYTMASTDIISLDCITPWGRDVLDGVPESQIQFLEPAKAPEVWFKGVDKVVDRVLITAGDAECLRDDIVVFAKQFCKYHEKAQFVLQQHGIHNDPYFDFFTKESKLGELTPLILAWAAAGFDQS